MPTANRQLPTAPGLKLRGSVWHFRYRQDGRQRSRRLAAKTPAGARREAVALRKRLAAGEDISAVPAAALPTFREFCARYMAEVVRRVRKEPAVVQRYLDRELLPLLGARRLDRVTGMDLQRLVFARRDAGKPMAAAAIRDLAKRVFDYGRVCGFITANPADATPVKFIVQRRSRSRSLSAVELAVVRRALEGKNNGNTAALPRWARDMALLLLLTLCRKSEMRLARWEQFDLDAGLWEIPAAMSKTGMPHVVYLSDPAVALLRRRASESAGPAPPGEWLNPAVAQWAVAKLSATHGHPDVRAFVFPSPSSPTRPMAAGSLNAAMALAAWGVPHFTPHDLRRTGATLLSERGFNSDWIEKALNHTVKGIRGVYNRAAYAEQRRTMLAAWGEFVMTGCWPDSGSTVLHNR